MVCLIRRYQLGLIENKAELLLEIRTITDETDKQKLTEWLENKKFKLALDGTKMYIMLPWANWEGATIKVRD